MVKGGLRTQWEKETSIDWWNLRGKFPPAIVFFFILLRTPAGIMMRDVFKNECKSMSAGTRLTPSSLTFKAWIKPKCRIGKHRPGAVFFFFPFSFLFFWPAVSVKEFQLNGHRRKTESKARWHEMLMGCPEQQKLIKKKEERLDLDSYSCFQGHSAPARGCTHVQYSSHPLI